MVFCLVMSDCDISYFMYTILKANDVPTCLTFFKKIYKTFHEKIHQNYENCKIIFWLEMHKVFFYKGLFIERHLYFSSILKVLVL